MPPLYPCVLLPRPLGTLLMLLTDNLATIPRDRQPASGRHRPPLPRKQRVDDCGQEQGSDPG
jgi:hypothetical protein